MSSIWSLNLVGKNYHKLHAAVIAVTHKNATQLFMANHLNNITAKVAESGIVLLSTKLNWNL